MSDSESFIASKPPWLKGLVALAVLVGAILVFRAVAPAVMASRQMTAERLAQQVENDPIGGESFRSIKSAYPNEYRAFLVRTVEVIRREGAAAAEREAFHFSRSLMRSKLDDMLRAPALRLRGLAGAYADLIRALGARDVGLCGRFVTVGITPETRMPRELLSRFNNLLPLQISLAQDGADERRATRRDASQAEATAFMERLATISPAAAELVQDDARLMAATATQQCDAGLAIYRAAATLPPETSANIMAVLIRESFQSP